jgi:hypothetical protein
VSDIFNAWTPGQALPLEVALFSLLLAFILSQVIAAGYIWTFRGMSYSRAFVQAVALGSVVAAMLMLAINNSIAAGLGIAGSLAIVRFRTAMRDPRDMVFVFASMGAGIASGLRAWAPAILGTLIFFVAAAALAFTELGSQRVFDGLLRFQAPANPDTEEAVARVLRSSTKSFALVTLREVAQGAAMEHAYQVRLGATASRTSIIEALGHVPGISDITFLLQEPTVEL